VKINNANDLHKIKMFKCSKKLARLIEMNTCAQACLSKDGYYYFAKCNDIKNFLSNINPLRKIFFMKEIERY